MVSITYSRDLRYGPTQTANEGAFKGYGCRLRIRCTNLAGLNIHTAAVRGLKVKSTSVCGLTSIEKPGRDGAR